MTTDTKPPMEISAAAIARLKAALTRPKGKEFPIQPPALLPGVVPQGAKSAVAMDWGNNAAVYGYANQAFGGVGFPGYPYLAELAQRVEYRSPSETTAAEMTRKWVRLAATGDGDKSAKLQALEAALTKYKVRELFRWAVEMDGYFGHAQVYVAIKGQDNDDARKLPLILSPATIPKGSLIAFRGIEPLWTTPVNYNANDPTAADFYKPRAWFLMGKETHASRLLEFVGRPVPDMLKPAYNFGGMSLSQLMEPYVNNWLRTRDAVSDLINNFSLLILGTNLSTTLQGGGADDLAARAQFFNETKSNTGLLMRDMDTEEVTQLNVPLSSLDKLQAQAQEQMAAPSHTPLVKLLGVTPAGLNANSDGEIRVYYDFIDSVQERMYRDTLTKVLAILQLNEFGVVDDSITFDFEPLMQLDGKELAEVRKSDADAAVAYIQAGVLSPEEERQRLVADPNSGYNSLEPGDLPEPPEPEPGTVPEGGPDADTTSTNT